MFTAFKRHAGVILLLLCLCGTVALGESVSPTTGMAYPDGRDGGYRPILVNISNTVESRPQLGMSLADIVYEYVFWGPGYTRYLALFNDALPEMVGSVRSAKAICMSLQNTWDCPIVFIGGDSSSSSDSTYGYIDAHRIPASMLFDGTEAGGPDARINDVLSRTPDREAPHDAVANLQALARKHWPEGTDASPHQPIAPPFQFGEPPTQGDSSATEVTVTYDATEFAVRYVYDEAAGHYKRFYNGAAHVDGLTQQQFIANNVIVHYAPLTFPGDVMSQPVWGTSGEGKIDAFIGGRHIAGRWQRASEDAALACVDLDGNPLVLSPGKTFVQIVPEDMEISIR